VNKVHSNVGIGVGSWFYRDVAVGALGCCGSSRRFRCPRDFDGLLWKWKRDHDCGRHIAGVEVFTLLEDAS
jgi:hypothetical protein